MKVGNVEIKVDNVEITVVLRMGAIEKRWVT